MAAVNVGLFWFRQDLRLQDNPALVSLAAQVDRLVCCYVVDPSWLRPGPWQSRPMGEHRRQFLYESLTELRTALEALGQTLYVLVGSPVQQLSALISSLGVQQIASSYHPGSYERWHWQRLQAGLPDCRFMQSHSSTLFLPEQLPFELPRLPETFSQFHRLVECLSPTTPVAQPTRLPPPPVNLSGSESLQQLAPAQQSSPWHGGEAAAERQLQRYVADERWVEQYADTRNALLGWASSSKFSAWLAAGCLSVRSLAWQLDRYEQAQGSSTSTEKLFFELLWREFFYWYLSCHGNRLFAFDGVRRRRPLTSFYPQRFQQWCQGATPYPIVNACMKELNATGFMSNRGRQLVASCLVNELSLDWRYGAAYFEQQLIDYDVALNWGNWQYLAGVGADPRGSRRFNLAKQTQMYDPQGEFIRRWDAEQILPMDSVDAADWPIVLNR